MNCCHLCGVLLFLICSFLKGSDPILLVGGKELKPGAVPTLDEVIVQNGAVINAESNLRLKGFFGITGSNYDYRSLEVLQDARLFMRFNDFHVSENIEINKAAIQLQGGVLQCEGELRWEAAKEANKFKNGTDCPLVILLDKNVRIVSKSWKINSWGKNFPIGFFSYGRVHAENFLASGKPCIEITESIETKAPIDLYIYTRAKESFPSGKYPLIRASRIEPTLFNLRFFESDDTLVLSDAQRGHFHLEFDETTVWLVIDEDVN